MVMKSWRNLFVGVFFLLFFGFCSVSFGQISEVWVAPTGNDQAAGSKQEPLGSLSMALRKVRELRRLKQHKPQEAVHIYLKGGNYFLPEPIRIKPEDSGTSQSPTIVSNAPNEEVILSGGMLISNWQLLKEPLAGLSPKAKGKVWVADVPNLGDKTLLFRQLWVNNRKAIRAKNTSNGQMFRILAWDKKQEICWIPKPQGLNNSNIQGTEMLIHQWWEIANLRIKSINIQGDSAALHFYQPESKLQSEHPWPAPWISKETGNSAFYLCNNIAFLDEAGEWFYDTNTQKLYYIPRLGENITQAKVVVPVLENLLRIEGTEERKVKNIHFRNLQFQHSSWLRPSQVGHVPHQAGMPMTEAYKLKIPGTPEKKSLENQAWITRPAAAVQVTFAENTSFEGCRFEHLAATGLDYYKGLTQHSIEGNVFKDIGGTALLVGEFSDDATEIHLPYQPENESVLVKNITIKNNLISDATNEDWGSVGIGAGYVQDVSIEHNEVNQVNYSGISLGWGWTPTVNVMKNNRIIANKIHHYGKQMYDVAGIYTLSAQPNTWITHNYIDSIYKAPYAHIPSHWFYLYTDEGSSFMTIQHNWTPSTKFLQNANGPNNRWENNGPMVADSIKQQAGLTPAFQHLLAYNTPNDTLVTINKEKPVGFELIFPDKNIPLTQIKAFVAKYQLPANGLYQWQNRVVFFGKVQDVFVMRERFKQQFPQAKLQTYDDYFYEFNRSNCGEKIQESQAVKHIILTANLVANPQKQQAYLDFHAKQLKEWPEVAQGFCKADFQQLLIYKNGRQLLLIISIPANETLDHLNPRTTENNPKMVAWNNQMKQFQEGIEGTKPDETWVFFEPIP